ncbi:MAG: class I SAM-dependent methyltransferase [Solirubrobacteraceae bacterium]
MSRVIWHDVECGGYTADLELWRELARATGDPVLDVGAGTGRVARHLEAAGHEVVALDNDEELLAVLRRRAPGVQTVVADAAEFHLDRSFALIAVPMQTIQLLPDRAGFFASARRAVRPGGLVALAIADALEGFDAEAEMPPPDVGQADGWRYVSQPTAVRPVSPGGSPPASPREGGARIERLRYAIAPDGARTTERDAIVLAAVTAEQLEAEGAAAGLIPEPARHIDATPEHVGSRVVLLRG